CYCEGNLSA
ncbi:unnamed protein product, partial [Allacma fusca]